MAARCQERSTGPATTLSIARSGGERVERSALVVCNRRSGSARVLARARIVRSQRAGGSGRFFSDAAATAGLVAYAEVRLGRRSLDQVVVTVLHARTLRRVRRVRFVRVDGLDFESPEVAIAADGTLVLGRAEERLRIARPGRRPQVIGPFLRDLTVQDGRTIVWTTDSGEAVRFLDLQPVPAVDGCPARSAFSPAARTDMLTVTQFKSDRTAIRVCDRATGSDPVIASASGFNEGGTQAVGVIGALGTLVAVSETFEGKSGCSARVIVVDGRTGERVRTARDGACEWTPSAPVPTVFTPARSAAWVVAGASGDRLVAMAGEQLRLLDEGARGTITDLRATDRGVAWRSGGADRAATLD